MTVLGLIKFISCVDTKVTGISHYSKIYRNLFKPIMNIIFL